MNVLICAEDLALFERASFDSNPLHLSDTYARTTQFGQRVVFGILATLFALGKTPLPEGHGLAGIRLEFVGPVFMDIPYQVKTEIPAGSSDRIMASLWDGSRMLLKATLRLRPDATGQGTVPTAGTAPRREADAPTAADLKAGAVRSGAYAVEPDAFLLLRERTGVTLPTLALSSLLWSSYLIGMELPGRQALFSYLNLDFEPGLANLDPAFIYEAQVKSHDERFHLLKVAVSLTSGGTTFARGELRAMVRQAASATSEQERTIQDPQAFAGKVALVIGGSRGLGAQIVRAFARQGATVVSTFARSRPEAEAVVESLGKASGNVQLEQGDGSDLDWTMALARRIQEEHGRLDYLICNACPAIQPMFLETTSAARVNRYVADSVALVSVPIAACTELLTASAGTIIAISSIYVEETPANYPHYVSAKFAIEGLIRTLALHHPRIGFLIVRPPRLVGELDVPFGNVKPLAPEIAALTITDHLTSMTEKKGVELLHSFPTVSV